MSVFNDTQSDYVAVFGKNCSADGIKALKKNLCHAATCHLIQEDWNDYNCVYAAGELGHMPANVNFCNREQGLIVQKGNPKCIKGFSDLGNTGVRVVNCRKGTCTRLLFDHELKKAGMDFTEIKGYDIELQDHLDVGLEVASGRADTGLGIKAFAVMLDLDFVPVQWEHFDLIVPKNLFFTPCVQSFLYILRRPKLKACVGWQAMTCRMRVKLSFPIIDSRQCFQHAVPVPVGLLGLFGQPICIGDAESLTFRRKNGCIIAPLRSFMH